ncbi:hypothetical protein BCR36DRAFT_587450 [Piromyces finnis]|uniref:Protein PNS1 n=1 Tax=Piromyces finnis TaxID=1754191 RepID=A0A1Y1UWY8_9FUNG|nr:hypothetical protein BCR36DRAFT_587450 [Piromyces finnis]|eukprot:ORX42150.1 hypothetical protein BCR36DRAFT_587450 [Piromyces finnis]
MEYSDKYPMLAPTNNDEDQSDVPSVDVAYQMNDSINTNYSPSAPTFGMPMPMPINQNNNMYYNANINTNNSPAYQYNDNGNNYSNNNYQPQYQYAVNEDINIQLQSQSSQNNNYNLNGTEQQPSNYGYATPLNDEEEIQAYSSQDETKSTFSAYSKSEKDRTKPFHNLPVLHHAKRKFSGDFIFGILFFALTLCIGYVGWRDRDNLTDPTTFCRFVTDIALPDDMPSTTSKVSDTFYDNCLGFVVSGDEFAEGRCFSFGVNEVVKGENNKAKRDFNSELYRRANVSDTTINTITGFYDECVKYIIDGDKSAADKCIRFAVNLFGKSENVSDKTDELLNSCISPMVNNEKSSHAKCVDYAITELIKSTGLEVEDNANSVDTGKIWELCADEQDPEACVNEALQTAGVNVNTDDITQLESQCIKPILADDDNKSVALNGCIKYGLDKAGVSTPLVTSIFNGCINQFLTAEDNTDGSDDDRSERLISASTGCLRNVALITLSSNDVLKVIEEGAKNALGVDLGLYINDRCLQKSFFGALNGDFLPSSCFLSGLATSFCKDLQKRSLDLATSLFEDTLDTLHQKLIPFTKVLVWIIISNAAIGLVWMALIIIITSKIVYISIAFSLINMSILILVNLIIQNYIGCIIISIYFVIKIFWYIFTRHKIRFASSLLRTTMTSLYRQLGPFVLAFILFILSSIWFLLIFSAFITFNKPSVVSYIVSYSVTGFLLILCFFWTFEVGKNVMAVAISGVTANWYYFTSTNPEYVIRDNHPSVHFPTIYSTGRALLSFGTICFGSLITAALRVFNYLYRKGKNTDSVILKTIILSSVSCLEYVLQVYNSNAFVIVAVYGSSYCKASVKTSKIVKKNGIQMMVNNDIIDGVMRTGKSVSSFIIGFVGFFLAFIVYKLSFFLSTVLGIFGFVYGYVMLSMIAIVVEISASAFFVCFADHPEVMAAYHPKMYKKFVKRLHKFFKDNNEAIPDILNLPTKEERKLAKAKHKAERKSKKQQMKQEKKEQKQKAKEAKKQQEMKQKSKDTVITINSSNEKVGSNDRLI